MTVREKSLTVLLLAALLVAGCRPKPLPAPSPAPPPASSQPPRILAVSTDPPLPVQEGGWHVLPPGSSVVTLRVAHVLVQVEGPGGLTEDESLQVFHDEPASPR